MNYIKKALIINYIFIVNFLRIYIVNKGLLEKNMYFKLSLSNLILRDKQLNGKPVHCNKTKHI